MTTTTDDELLALCDAATPGPWENGDYCVGIPGTDFGTDHPPRDGTIASLYDVECIENPNAVADAAYIAAASPDRVKALVMRVRALEANVTEWATKLTEGRLHAGWCNVADTNPVGCPGCSCPVSHRMGDLRERLKRAEEALRPFAEAWTNYGQHATSMRSDAASDDLTCAMWDMVDEGDMEFAAAYFNPAGEGE